MRLEQKWPSQIPDLYPIKNQEDIYNFLLISQLCITLC